MEDTLEDGLGRGSSPSLSRGEYHLSHDSVHSGWSDRVGLNLLRGRRRISDRVEGGDGIVDNPPKKRRSPLGRGNAVQPSAAVDSGCFNRISSHRKVNWYQRS